MIFLLAVQRAAPLPVAHRIRAVPDRLPGHLAHLAAIQHDVHRRPVHGAGLGLHHPEILALETSRQVVRHAVARGVQVAAADIIVPRGQIQFLAKNVMIEHVVPAHEIGGDELARVARGADRLHLDVLEVADGSRQETLELQVEPRIAARTHGNLAPIGVGLAPILGGPVPVERIQRFILSAQPFLKLAMGFVVPRERAVLVVDLPADDVRIMAPPLRHLLRDAAAELAITHAGGRPLLAIAVLGLAPVLLGAQRVRILLRQPGGRGRAGRANHDRDAVLAVQRHRAIQPVEIELALLRFQAAPGEFANAHHVDVRGLHQL